VGTESWESEERQREDHREFLRKLAGGKDPIRIGHRRSVVREQNQRINDWLISRGFNPLPVGNPDLGRPVGPSDEVIANRKARDRARLAELSGKKKAEVSPASPSETHVTIEQESQEPVVAAVAPAFQPTSVEPPKAPSKPQQLSLLPVG
jgi:hypothetical protein